MVFNATFSYIVTEYKNKKKYEKFGDSCYRVKTDWLDKYWNLDKGGNFFFYQTWN